MTSGYDLRQRLSGPQQYYSVDPVSHLVENRGKFLTSSEQVTSFRSDTRGTRLEPSQVDPFMGFFRKSNYGLAEYMNPGPQLLSKLEAAGLAQESDYVSVDGNRLDNGHPFQSVKQSVRTSLRGLRNDYVAQNMTSLHRVGGPIFHTRVEVNSAASGRMPFRFALDPLYGTRICKSDVGIPAPDLTNDDLPSYGTKAMSLCAPSVPHVSLVASVGELLQGLPAVPGYALLRSGAFSTSGDEYLNWVFGILPTLSDARKFAETLNSLSLSLYQLRRDEGKRVRRSFTFPVEQKTEIFAPADLGRAEVGASSYGRLGFSQISYPGDTGSSSLGYLGDFRGNTELFMSLRREIRFSGSFTYHLPEIPGFSGRLEQYMSEYDRLFGLSLDAKAAWQLMPWSWLIDWFTDITENLKAIEVAHDDNLVMNYGYAMESSVRTVIAKTTFSPSYTKLNFGGTRFLNTLWKTEVKRRIRANPYGFVSSADGGFWTPYRMAVLAALGISRA
jgi:hypothetical protein